MISGKSIFISPLDWGLGHATRCVSIIRELEKENKIIIGVTPATTKIFDIEFPHLEKVDMPAYDIKYGSVLPVWLKLVTDWPRIATIIKKEHTVTNFIISKYKIDIVISDNRFGMYSKDAHTIFITHQVFLKTPFANMIAQNKNADYIKNFDELWIPDYENEAESLAGSLSHGRHFHNNIKYVGPKSAFVDLEINSIAKEKSDYLILLSGVEPQRSILEKKLIERFKDSEKRVVLVRGSNSGSAPAAKNIKVVDLVFGADLKEQIVNAETVICRSGYSTLMDMHLLKKKKIILIPTPGQTEQEYLADYWKKKFGTEVCLQKDVFSFEF